MKGNDDHTSLISLVADLRESEVLALVNERIEKMDDPLAIVHDCQQGMIKVGEFYAEGKYYISGLIMAGEIFRQVMELVQPAIQKSMTGNESRRVLLGTVKGDIHDLGKNIFGMFLSCHGFSIYDMGVDVLAEDFVIQSAEFKPHIIGLSGILTTAIDSMRETVSLLRNANKDTLAAPRIIIGGSMVDENVFNYVGSDLWAADAMTGVSLCKQYDSKITD